MSRKVNKGPYRGVVERSLLQMTARGVMDSFEVILDVRGAKELA